MNPSAIYLVVITTLCLAVSTAFAQDTPVGRAYVNCLLAHAIDVPQSTTEDDAGLILLHKCASEMGAIGRECEASGVTNCSFSVTELAYLAFRIVSERAAH
jgi:hypothetical protein